MTESLWFAEVVTLRLVFFRMSSFHTGGGTKMEGSR